MHPDVAYSISRLGTIAYNQGDYGRAETLFGASLRIREATLGPDHLDVADSLSDLASMFLVRGDYVQPEPLYQRALAIYEKQSASSQTSAPGADVQLLIADVLSNLAFLSQRRGDHTRAESHYLKALAIRERTRGPDDPSTAETLANLGAVHYAAGQYSRAAQVLRRALGIQEKRLPANHPSLATSSFNLAAVYHAQGDFQNAEPLFVRALAIDEQALDPQHPRLAVRLFGLAELLRLKGEYARADPLYERALTIRERALGPTHPEVAKTLIAWSLLRYATGDVDGAVDLLARGAVLREDTLGLVLTTGSEEQKRLYLGTLVDETDIAISLHLGSAPAGQVAARLALANVLQRKGRSIDAMADHMATLRRRFDETDREMLNQLSNAQSRLATMVLRGVASDDQRKSMEALRRDVQELEQAISARSGEFRAASRTATLEQVQSSLPGETALIELVSYRPFSVHKARDTAFGAPRYAAYVLRNDGSVTGIDLQDAAIIDRHVERFRAALSNPADRGVRAAARTLHQALVAPLQGALRDVERIIVSPDGALNLIPFSALVGDDGKYLMEHFPISYVTSGRDLVRLRELAPSAPGTLAPPTVIADPLFDGLRVASASAARMAGTRALPASVLEQALRFDALPGTAQEAAALAKVLPEARVHTGADATEALLKQLRSPSILHIATHGFFLRPRPARRATASGRGSVVASPQPGPADREDALVLSGLALAGANQRWSGDGEDGILTALEVAGLDLWGTRMVVLSACETGLGDARNGEGVYGLRRALVLAGSESQVISLWKVSDSATRDLMISYYQRLRSGEGRADALRNVQLAFLRNGKDRIHPFYWAGFIQSGDWRAIID